TGVSNAYAEAGAENQYVQASGVRAGYDSSSVFNGDFVNAGGISAAAYGLIENQATATAAGGEATAASYIDGFGVSATGVYASFVTVGGDFINEGTVTADATAIGRSRATANGASAVAGDELAVRALAEGVDFSAGLMFGDFVNDGDVTARAVASLDSHNIATATSGSAQAAGGVDSFMGTSSTSGTQAVAEGDGVVAGFAFSAGWMFGDFVKDGDVTARAVASLDSHNMATATSGSAQAGGGVDSFMGTSSTSGTQAVAEAYGVVAGFGSALLGAFENN